MNERRRKRKGSVQFIAKLLLILLFPFVFFQFIGDNPTKIIEQQSRVLAVVNEDVGAELEDGDTLQLGHELVRLLGENSDYEWTVVNRNAAENGLKQNRFDAIIYISSDFSSNILTFEEENPVKASVQYKIQTNLDAKNRHRVQKEMERMKNDINKHMSTIYWAHVSEEVEAIRKRFEQIVEKEVAFQQAMYSFYTPGSQKLSSEVSTQKSMIEGILDATQSLGETSKRNVDQSEKAKEQLLAFANLIEDYKEYQKEQREHILQKQEENKLAIEEGIQQYEQILNSGKNEIEQINVIHPNFDKEREQFTNSLNLIQNLFAGINKERNQYQAIREAQVDVQIASMEALHNQLLNYYHHQMHQLVFQQLENNLEQLKNEIGPRDNSEGADNEFAIEDVAVIFDLENHASNEVSFQELKNLLNGLRQLLSDSDEEELPLPINEQFQNIESEIQQLETNMNEIVNENNELNVKFNELKNDFGQLLEKYNDDINALMNQLNSIFEDVIKAVEKLEQDILHHSNLPDDRKEILEKIFEGELNPNKLLDVIDYYAYLKTYFITLDNMEETGSSLIGEILQLEDLRKTLEEKLQVSGLELEKLSDLKDEIDKTDNEVTIFGNLYLQVLDEYKTYADIEYQEIITILEDVQKDTNEVTEMLMEANNSQPEVKETPMVENVKGEVFLTIHDQSIQQLKHLSELLESLEERQDSLNDYTSRLQENVNNVQMKADELNTNWALNVDFTKKVKEDVYGVLNNAIVDGQNNGYVYEYLANPVRVSGETPPEKTEQTPPVVMLIIIVISGLLIGYFCHYYSNSPFFVQLSMFLLLNIAVGLLIGIYGLNIYPMENEQAMKWSALIILSLFACSAIVKGAFSISPFTGMVIGIMLVIYFVFPLLDLLLPNFSLTHPIADLLMSVQYRGDQSSYYPTVVLLILLTIIFLSVQPMIKKLRTSPKKDVPYEG